MTCNIIGVFKYILITPASCLALPPPTVETLQRKRASLPLSGSYKQPKEQLFSSNSPEITEKSISLTGQSQAFSCAYRPGIKSNKAVEAKWPSLRRIKISGKTSQAQPELHNLLLQSMSLFLQKKHSLENEQTCGPRSIIPTGRSPIQQ